MGILLAAVFVPSYIIVSLLAIWILVKTKKPSNISDLWYVFGFILSTIIALLLIKVIPSEKGAYGEYSPVFYTTFLTLVVPAIVAILFTMVSWFFKNKLSRVFECFSIAAIGLTLFMPWITIVAGLIYEDVQSNIAYSKACLNAEVKYLFETEPAKNIYLKTDNYWQFVKNRSSSSSRVSEKILLNHSFFKMIESSKNIYEKDRNKDYLEFTQLNTLGEKDVSSEHDFNETVKFKESKYRVSTAEYILSSSESHRASARKKGVNGQRLEIHRTSDEKLIAYAQYYWNSTKSGHKMCPEEAKNDSFPYRFITKALNVVNAESVIWNEK